MLQLLILAKSIVEKSWNLASSWRCRQMLTFHNIWVTIVSGGKYMDFLNIDAFGRVRIRRL